MDAHPLLDNSPKYVPYTPRQRGGVSTATTTGTIVEHNHGNATSKLQLMHLKAAAQNVGLDSSTVGWAILERLIDSDDLWHTVTSSRANIFLPLEPMSTSDGISQDVLKDHVYLEADGDVLTMSGLRGTIDGHTLTFRSTISTSSKLYHDVFTRSSPLTVLPRLPQPTNAYPRFAIYSEPTTLPLPPRTPAQKPPLPPRPSRTSGPAARIPNPFASLFGNNPTKNTPAAPASPPTSIRSFDSSTQDSVPVDITIVTTDRKIVRKDVGKQINKSLKNELKEMLTSATPPWVADRVADFASGWFPFVRVSSSEKNEREYRPNPLEENPDDAADRLQDFYASLEQDLRNQSEKELGESTRDVMEAVERTISSLFYDRLFIQPTTDDASHDEALASRIVALNKLDLGLEHLDVVVGNTGPDIDIVVKACGEMLSQLDPCKCPADKAAVLVAAHKVIVDGLSRLPPIRLKTEDEPQTAKPKPKPEPVLSHINILRSTPSQSRLREEEDLTPRPDAEAFPSPLPISTPLPTEFNASEKQLPAAPSEKPTLEPAPAAEPTPVSGDLLFPMLIFSVVKSNPPHLLSNLLFTQRFRNHSVGGEESYCLINLLAVAEFLENVDLEGLGLTGDGDKVVSVAELTPIPLARSPVTSETPLAPSSDGPHTNLRNRVEQQVDAIADSANKVITGVVDSSFGILRSFLPNNANNQSQSGGSRPTTPGGTDNVLSSSWKSASSIPRPGFGGLLRRETTGGGGSSTAASSSNAGNTGTTTTSGFSIANIAASLPITGRSRANTGNTEELGQQLVSVSGPGSVRSRSRGSLKIRVAGESSGSETTSDDDDDDDEDSDDSENGDENKFELGSEPRSVGSTRSIRSFESMVAAEKAKHRKKKKTVSSSQQSTQNSGSRPTRTSLSDRLARVSSNLASSVKGSPPPSRRSSLLLQPPAQSNRGRSSESPASSRSPSPVQYHQQRQLRIAPPVQHFLDTTPGDLRLSEIGDLLKEYKRLVEAIRGIEGFDE